MRKLKAHRFILSALLVMGTLGFVSISVYADGNGGAISTKGQITLLTEETIPSTDSSSSDSSVPDSSTPDSSVPDSSVPDSSTPKPSPSESSQSPIITKPQGKYPSTGELVKTSLSISGVVLLMIVLIVFWWKRKKDQESREEGN